MRQSGAPNCLSPQKTRGPKKSTPNVFFLFPVLVFQRGAPKSARSPENVIGPQNLKMEAPNDFFVPCFSAGSKQRGALKSPRPPKAKPQTKKTARPQSLKRRGSKSRPANVNPTLLDNVIRAVVQLNLSCTPNQIKLSRERPQSG